MDSLRVVVIVATLVWTSWRAVIPLDVLAPNVSMPMLALGTMDIYGCAVSSMVERWLRLGGRHLEMSQLYGTYLDIGVGIRASGVPRKNLFLTTKVETLGYAAAIAQINSDLVAVGVEYFDLVLNHFPCTMGTSWADFPNKCGSQEMEERLATWRGLEYLKSIGKARAIGVSNYDEEQLFELLHAGYHPAVNSVQWHLGYHNDSFLAMMKSQAIVMMAWSPLAGLTHHFWQRNGYFTDDIHGVSLEDPRLMAVATKYNVTPAQVALQWSIKKGVAPMTGTCSDEHLKEDIAIMDFSLSEDAVAYLDSLKGDTGSALFM